MPAMKMLNLHSMNNYRGRGPLLRRLTLMVVTTNNNLVQ